LRGRKSRPGYPEAPKILGEHLRRARLDRGLLQRQLAVRIGCSQASLLNWETEKSEPEVRFLPAILAFLGYDPRPAPGGFGERLRHTREARGFSQGALAREAGEDETALQGWDSCQARRRAVADAEVLW
jgi:transcriptional regulator with XRE-family HTH domain